LEASKGWDEEDKDLTPGEIGGRRMSSFSPWVTSKPVPLEPRRDDGRLDVEELESSLAEGIKASKRPKDIFVDTGMPEEEEEC